jgi:hypothetical protein
VTWETKQLARNVIQVKVAGQRRADWEQWFLLSGDRHWDNPKSNHELQKDHLEEAVKRNAGVIDIGDLFCAMQGKYDPRSSKSDVRPEHRVDSYLDSLVSTAADFFEPWSDRLIVLGVGNHEESIRKRHETHLTDRLVSILNDRTGSDIVCGGYGGWVRFVFDWGNGATKVTLLNYSHGYGGGGPVTKGTIQSNRRAIYLPDASLVVSGHIHERWMLDLQRVRINNNGGIYHDTQTHVVVPTYKEEYGDGYGGWHVERGAPPKPIGAAWLRFYWSSKPQRVNYDIVWAQ